MKNSKVKIPQDTITGRVLSLMKIMLSLSCGGSSRLGVIAIYLPGGFTVVMAALTLFTLIVLQLDYFEPKGTSMLLLRCIFFLARSISAVIMEEVKAEYGFGG